ncbi:Calcium/calmodulin-dependent 3',5'-cyclic nucleotide phosphodiesterase 1B [Perkinsus chesapeaki]|uniref:Calcium/calmodulin-dependent 3',5'-cyclic nucleotide phosphodiesterase 1B n=1 Tax=Perkinsus chesapeaki TaxID=330153 RepID=A0A7J6MGF4_PERCH|nr:Calcium/calmodulin-dependent 3',5'-cyclic nucleotide phosphodiesterase 1B [Perkinsus chesapeaki]
MPAAGSLEEATGSEEDVNYINVWKRYESDLEESLTDPSWSIFEFIETIPVRRELVRVVGMFLVHRILRGTQYENKVDLRAVSAFLGMVQAGYKQTYGYHTMIHSADTAITIYHMIQVFEEPKGIHPLDELAAVLAAFGHDVGHPGWSNSLAKALGMGEAEDPHPLESMHARETTRMLSIAGLDGLLGDRRVRMMEEMIVCTCMDYHTFMLEKARTYAAEDLQTRLSILLHCADISNPTKEAKLSQQWSIRCSFEFWREHDLSREIGVVPPPSVPPRSLTSPGYALCQLGFYKNVALPLFEALDSESEWACRLRCNIQARIDLIAAYAPTRSTVASVTWQPTAAEASQPIEEREAVVVIEDQAEPSCSEDGIPSATPSLSSDPIIIDGGLSSHRRRSSLFRIAAAGGK